MLRAMRLRAVQPRDQNYRPSNLNPEDILDLGEHCQVEIIGGWTKKRRLLTAAKTSTILTIILLSHLLLHLKKRRTIQ